MKESPWTLSPSRILHDVPMRSMLACVALSLARPLACMFGDQEKSEGGHLSQSLSLSLVPSLPIRLTCAPFPSPSMNGLFLHRAFASTYSGDRLEKAAFYNS